MGHRIGETGSVVGSNSTGGSAGGSSGGSTDGSGGTSGTGSTRESSTRVKSHPALKPPSPPKENPPQPPSDVTPPEKPPQPPSEITPPKENTPQPPPPPPPSKGEIQTLTVISQYLSRKREMRDLENAVLSYKEFLESEKGEIEGTEKKAKEARELVLQATRHANLALDLGEEELRMATSALVQAVEREEGLKQEIVNRIKFLEDVKGRKLPSDEKEMVELEKKLNELKDVLMGFKTLGVSNPEHITEIYGDEAFENIKCFILIPPSPFGRGDNYKKLEAAAKEAGRRFERRAPWKLPTAADDLGVNSLNLN